MPEETLTLTLRLPLQAHEAGLLVSRGRGRHGDRVWPTFDLIFVSAGVLHIQEAGRLFEVRSGETLLLWPGRKHGGTHPYPPDLTFYWVHFSLSGGAEEDSTLLAVPQHATLRRPDRMTALFRRFLDDQEAGGQDTLTASLLVLQMLAEIARAPLPGGHATTTGAVLAGRADAYIHAHFHQPLTASVVAATLGCNANYLARLYRQEYGITLTEAIHQRRLDYARRLLLEGYANIDEIARECGFEDVGYFRRLFKRREGLTPLAFRRLYARVFVNTE